MKKDLRRVLLEKRSSLAKEEAALKSRQIFTELRATAFYQEAERVMLYIAFRNEVQTEEIIEDLLRGGKRVFIPVTVHSTKAIIVSELKNPKEDLQLGNFGVLEPKPEAVRELDPSQLDLVLVPGVGFDKRGYRIGYGAGYYDRFLPRLAPHVPTVGLAFQLQLMEELPIDPYDYPLQYLLTEEGLRDCRSLQLK